MSFTWPVDFIPGGEMFIRGQYSYTGDSNTRLTDSRVGDLARNRPERNPTFTNESYQLADARIGLISNEGGWQVELFVNNITDERAEVYQGSKMNEFAFSNRADGVAQYHRSYTNRPREWGARFNYILGE